MGNSRESHSPAPKPKTVILTNKRKILIQNFKNENFRPAAEMKSSEWSNKLYHYLKECDSDIRRADVKRWIITHDWITSTSRRNPPGITASSLRANGKMTGRKSPVALRTRDKNNKPGTSGTTTGSIRTNGRKSPLFARISPRFLRPEVVRRRPTRYNLSPDISSDFELEYPPTLTNHSDARTRPIANLIPNVQHNVNNDDNNTGPSIPHESYNSPPPAVQATQPPFPGSVKKRILFRSVNDPTGGNNNADEQPPLLPERNTVNADATRSDQIPQVNGVNVELRIVPRIISEATNNHVPAPASNPQSTSSSVQPELNSINTGSSNSTSVANSALENLASRDTNTPTVTVTSDESVYCTPNNSPSIIITSSQGNYRGFVYATGDAAANPAPHSSQALSPPAPAEGEVLVESSFTGSDGSDATVVNRSSRDSIFQIPILTTRRQGIKAIDVLYYLVYLLLLVSVPLAQVLLLCNLTVPASVVNKMQSQPQQQQPRFPTSSNTLHQVFPNSQSCNPFNNTNQGMHYPNPYFSGSQQCWSSSTYDNSNCHENRGWVRPPPRPSHRDNTMPPQFPAQGSTSKNPRDQNPRPHGPRTSEMGPRGTRPVGPRPAGQRSFQPRPCGPKPSEPSQTNFNLHGYYSPGTPRRASNIWIGQSTSRPVPTNAANNTTFINHKRSTGKNMPGPIPPHFANNPAPCNSNRTWRTIPRQTAPRVANNATLYNSIRINYSNISANRSPKRHVCDIMQDVRENGFNQIPGHPAARLARVNIIAAGITGICDGMSNSLFNDVAVCIGRMLTVMTRVMTRQFLPVKHHEALKQAYPVQLKQEQEKEVDSDSDDSLPTTIVPDNEQIVVLPPLDGDNDGGQNQPTDHGQQNEQENLVEQGNQEGERQEIDRDSQAHESMEVQVLEEIEKGNQNQDKEVQVIEAEKV